MAAQGAVFECFYKLKLVFDPLIKAASASFRCMTNFWLNRYDRPWNFQNYRDRL